MLYYYQTEPLQVECVVLISTERGVFIGVQRGVTDLVKSVTRQAVAGRPWRLASIDLLLGIPLYRLLESVTVKPTVRGCKVSTPLFLHGNKTLENS
jgi:hypothetical protein